MRICAVQFHAGVGDIPTNLKNILTWLDRARSLQAGVILFPECAILGYLPLDKLFDPQFLQAHWEALDQIKNHSRGLHVLVGGLASAPHSPIRFYNAYHHFNDGNHLGAVIKTRLPNYDIFSDSRFFDPNPQPGKNNLVTMEDCTLGIGICEDMWHDAELFNQIHSISKPHLWVCPSASPYVIGKSKSRKEQIRRIIHNTHVPFLFLNQVASYDGILFDGSSYLLGADEKIVAKLHAFEEEALVFELQPAARAISKISSGSSGTLHRHEPKKYRQPRVEILAKALEFGVRNFVRGCGLKKAVVCVSGGLDSAVTLLVTKRALGAESCLALILPSRYNKVQSTLDAISLCTQHQVPYHNISIEELFCSFSRIPTHYFGKQAHPTVFENLQARIRGIIAMTFANQLNACLMGTSNKSELSMGYATLYGDLCAGLLVLGDVLKTQVYSLADYYRKIGEVIPDGTFRRVPSAELADGQKDTDTLPPYDVLDPAIANALKHELSQQTFRTPGELENQISVALAKSQFKRKQTAPILKVSARDLSKGRQVIISGG